jgi:hypothetical protein
MNPSLRVDRAELDSAIRNIARHDAGVENVDAVFTLEDGQLVVRVPGMELRASACGEWNGTCRIALSVLRPLARAGLPESDDNGPYLVSVADGRLKLGPLSLSCEWEAVVTPAIQLPFNPPLVLILQLPLLHPRKEIERSGLAQVVAEAEERKRQALSDAAGILRALGVRRYDLERLAEECIRRGTVLPPDSAGPEQAGAGNE